MASIIPFKSAKGPGFIVANLPMPDGTFRTYRLFRNGPGTFRAIMRRWKAECEFILKNIVWN